MSAPRILDVCLAPTELLSGLDLGPLLADPDRSAFVVTRSGTFAGRWFERGQVLVCQGGARIGQAVVLVAHRRGWPMLGHQRGGGFTGDRGEPCSRDRWCTAGAVVAVWERRDLGWSCVELGTSLDVAPGSQRRRSVAPVPATGASDQAGADPGMAPVDFSQLSLFQPARAA